MQEEYKARFMGANDWKGLRKGAIYSVKVRKVSLFERVLYWLTGDKSGKYEVFNWKAGLFYLNSEAELNQMFVKSERIR